MVVIKWISSGKVVAESDLDKHLVNEWRDKIDDYDAMDDLLIDSRMDTEWCAVNEDGAGAGAG